MTWLGGWLREIILVVLLASFVEMLLPSKSMERYARLVLSLLVLLTMLSPIVSFLKGDAIKELSLAMDQQNLQGGLLSSGGQGAGTLKQILADGKKMAQGQQKQSLKLAANEIAEQMKDQITSETGEKGIQVTVALAMRANPEGGDALPAISSVTVQLPETQTIKGKGDPTEEAAASGSQSTAKPIKIPSVNPIKVDIKNNESTVTSNPDGPNVSEGSLNEGDQEKAKAIMKLLEQKWSLDAEAIVVQSSAYDAAKL